jgi:hypothetical protein
MRTAAVILGYWCVLAVLVAPALGRFCRVGGHSMHDAPDDVTHYDACPADLDDLVTGPPCECPEIEAALYEREMERRLDIARGN